MQASKEAKRNSVLKTGKFTKDELKRLFTYDAETLCNTYDLVSKSSSSVNEPQEEKMENSTRWSPYKTPECIPDTLMREAVKNAGKGVTWVNISSHSSISKQNLAELSCEIGDDMVKEVGSISDSEMQSQSEKCDPIVVKADKGSSKVGSWSDYESESEVSE